MFTGLIREIATVTSFDGTKLCIAARHRPKMGDSIAINGACLSVIELREDGFCVELGRESKKIVALENYKGRVHIEPAMRLSDRIEGHILQGHIDCVGTITRIVPSRESTDFYIQIPKEQIKFVIPKGSIAVDGVSLTVNEVFEESFRLTIIPITLKETLFGTYRVGRRVNIETDMFARYLYYMFAKKRSLDWETIERFQALF